MPVLVLDVQPAAVLAARSTPLESDILSRIAVVLNAHLDLISNVLAAIRFIHLFFLFL